MICSTSATSRNAVGRSLLTTIRIAQDAERRVDETLAVQLEEPAKEGSRLVRGERHDGRDGPKVSGVAASLLTTLTKMEAEPRLIDQVVRSGPLSPRTFGRVEPDPAEDFFDELSGGVDLGRDFLGGWTHGAMTYSDGQAREESPRLRRLSTAIYVRGTLSAVCSP